MANAMLSGVSAYFLIKMYIEDYLLILPIYNKDNKITTAEINFQPSKILVFYNDSMILAFSGNLAFLCPKLLSLEVNKPKGVLNKS